MRPPASRGFSLSFPRAAKPSLRNALARRRITRWCLTFVRVTRIDQLMTNPVQPSDFEWDDAKAASNLAKHGIGFELAIAVFVDDDRLEETDARRNYGETRLNVVGVVDGLCLTITFTLRDGAARIISARKAHRKERARYDNRS